MDIEYRFADVETRDDGAIITGIAMPHGSTANIMGIFEDSVTAGAFDDVTLNRMHAPADLIAFQCGRLALPYRAEPAQGVTPELISRTCRERYVSVPESASVLVGAVDSTCRTTASKPR